ncbi:hypothetical protein JAAARDRAFT_210552 [Jaapia argillacea MUCL 33604]|uniref:Uncharacterized protein n=1 Tax=Jaapia argillacea MUCL 33604 TaxID=933084 RepID=A0A067PER3_9AGAM|nr:hypothetical protein JAAARDRAFT_210552 [Jaapia argillacea MUCL 33604]
MANPAQTPKRKSRVLAALDQPLFEPLPSQLTAQLQTPGASGSNQGQGASGSRGAKRRALGLGSGSITGVVVNHPAGFPSNAGLAGDSFALLSGSSPRKPSGGLNPISSGFNLHYDCETPISAIDRGGSDQAARMAEFVTRSIDNLSHGVTVKDAMKKLGLRDNRDILPGMEVRLLPHQVIGVSWMLDQELKSPYKGGIMADEMGLGKTIQMIATMAMNMPKEGDKTKTTLIVVPSALMHQWKEELETKSNGLFTAHVHYGKEKLKSLAALRENDVIITTYQTLNLDLAVPKDVEADEKFKWLMDNGGILARMTWYRVVLDEAQFVRNRGTRSSQSVAMLRSKYRWMLTGTPVTNTLADIYGLIRFGRFRPWNDWNDFNQYIAKVQLEDAVLAGQRAQEVLKPILLRRTKDAKLEGEPLLKLPKKNIEIVKLKFTVEERELYDSFERKVKLRVNKFFKERSILKNHSAVFVMILRLRQLCCHPHLILSLAEGFEDPTLIVGSDADKELARANQLMGAAWVAQVKKGFMTRARMNDFDFSDDDDDGPNAFCPKCNDLFMNDSGRVLVCGHEICFDCLLDLRTSPIDHDGIFGTGTEQENLRAEKEYEEAAAKGYRPCPTCKKMNDCFAKVFRSSAFEPSDEELKEAKMAARRNRKRKRQDSLLAEQKTVKSFDAMLVDSAESSDEDMPDISDILAGTDKKKKVVVESDTETEDDSGEESDAIDLTMDDISVDLPPPSSTKKSSIMSQRITKTKKVDSSPSKPKTKHIDKKGKRKASATQRSDDEEEHSQDGDKGQGPVSDALIATWRKGDHNMEVSTKMTALIGLLKEAEVAGDKSICYSQWTSMLDLVEIAFNRHGIQSLRYDGKMDRQSREDVLMTFRKPGGPKVILISTKCGGVGLNLVAANRVINLDLSWNYASESQAYDRVHRLGQEKEVFVKRLVVQDTIEDRMLYMQSIKSDLASAALGEGPGNLHKLSVKDIKLLFGIKNHAT